MGVPEFMNQPGGRRAEGYESAGQWPHIHITVTRCQTADITSLYLHKERTTSRVAIRFLPYQSPSYVRISATPVLERINNPEYKKVYP